MHLAKWEWLELAINPMAVVKVRGVSERRGNDIADGVPPAIRLMGQFSARSLARSVVAPCQGSLASKSEISWFAYLKSGMMYGCYVGAA
jgi:hypothetical protein